MGDESSKGDQPTLTEEWIVHAPGLMSRWVRLPNGAKCHYVTAGDTGPAVILLHGGLPGSSGTAGFRLMAPFLGANGFRVYCPDQPGYGWADTQPKYWPTQGDLSHVDFIKNFADALCIDSFHVSGNSMGAQNIAFFATAIPTRIISYILIAGGIGDIIELNKRIPAREGKFTLNPDYKRSEWEGTEESMRKMIEGIIQRPDAVTPELVTMRNEAAIRQRDSYNALMAVRSPVTSYIPTDRMLRIALSTKGRFEDLTIPGLNLWGLDDVLSPVENGFLQEDALPNVQHFFPDECGHQGQTDQPEMFNQLFLEFFRDGKVSWKTAEWAGVSRRRPINPKLVEEPPGGFPKPNLSYYNQFTREVKTAKLGPR